MTSTDDNTLFGHKTPAFAQDRARRTYEALLFAAPEVFAAKGFDATQTPDIAERAGVSVGTFYRYFTDKREIFLEVVRRRLSDSHAEIMARLVPENFVATERRAAIEQILAILLDHIARSPGMQKVFCEMALRDPEVAELLQVFHAEARRRIAQLIAILCPPELVADPEATSYILHTAVVECATRIADVHGPCPISRERATAALTQLVHRVVFGVES